MSSYNLDVESFLAEIRGYPELWDHNCEDYKYRNRRQQAWEKIAALFISDFDEMREFEKEEVYKKLHGKWRNLRDSYVRQMRKGNTARSYAYGKYLTFLDVVYKPNPATSATGSDDGDQNGAEADQVTQPDAADSEPEDEKPLKPKRRRTKSKKDVATWPLEDVPTILESLSRTGAGTMKPNDTIEYVDTRFPEPSCSYTAEDDDKSFFDSLLPAVREFDMDQKLELRSQIISMIKNIRSTKKNDNIMK